MFRMIVAVLALFTVGGGFAHAQKPQMVKGTVKKVDVNKDLLIINQQLKGEKVDRELSIETSTIFIVTIDGKKVELLGKQGLEKVKEGASVNIKCDKDVKVLSVTIK
jgi:hypothetical protein